MANRTSLVSRLNLLILLAALAGARERCLAAGMDDLFADSVQRERLAAMPSR
jgi:hypothetical protein